jgi:hypothetical protein
MFIRDFLQGEALAAIESYLEDLERAASIPAPQPAPDAGLGEWRLSGAMVNRAIADGIRGGATITAVDVAYGEGRKHYGQIVVFDNPSLAEQIVADHNAVAGLVAALRDLVETARVVSWAHVTDSPCSCKGCAIEAARRALAAAGVRR